MATATCSARFEGIVAETAAPAFGSFLSAIAPAPGGAGFVPGPLLGKILNALRDWVLDDPARNVPERLIARARELREQIENDERGPVA